MIIFAAVYGDAVQTVFQMGFALQLVKMAGELNKDVLKDIFCVV